MKKATGLAAGVKLTPLIFVAYLLITRRVRAGATAAAAFAATVAVGIVLLPSQSRVFWLDGVFHDRYRIGDPANPSDQSLSGAVARLAGSPDPASRWWAVAALGHPPGPVRLLEGELYVLCGLAVLAGTALSLIKERARRQPGRR